MKTFGFILYLIFEIALPLAIVAFVMVSSSTITGRGWRLTSTSLACYP